SLRYGTLKMGRLPRRVVRPKQTLNVPSVVTPDECGDFGTVAFEPRAPGEIAESEDERVIAAHRSDLCADVDHENHRKEQRNRKTAAHADNVRCPRPSTFANFSRNSLFSARVGSLLDRNGQTTRAQSNRCVEDLPAQRQMSHRSSRSVMRVA